MRAWARGGTASEALLVMDTPQNVPVPERVLRDRPVEDGRLVSSSGRWSARLAGAGAERHLDGLRRAAPADLDAHGVTGLLALERAAEVVRRLDVLAVGLHDHVADLEPRLLGGRAGHDLLDEGPAGGRDVVLLERLGIDGGDRRRGHAEERV